MKTNKLKKGDTLPNGATLIRRWRLPNGQYILLCSYGEQFITWQAGAESNDTFWGHYFTKIETARKDFQKRSIGETGVYVEAD